MNQSLIPTRILVIIAISFCLMGPGLGEAISQTDETCLSMSKELRKDTTLSLLTRLYSTGVLAVRLKGYGRAISEIDRLLTVDGISAKAEEALLEKREGFIRQKNEMFQRTARAFTGFYNFSDVVYFYSDDQDQLSNGGSDVFMDRTGQKIDDPELADRIVLILAEGATNRTDIEAFLVFDHELNKPCDPMPQYFQLNRLVTFFAFGERGEEKKLEKMVQDVQATFTSLLVSLQE